MAARLRAWVYIDGLNLYYGAVKDTADRWLNLRALVERLAPEYLLERIKYFTSNVSSLPDDLGAPARQQVYLRALKTIPALEIIPGHFQTRRKIMHLASPDPTLPMRADVVYEGGVPMSRACVWRTEEKGSDVNLGVHLVHDGHCACYEAAVLVTNDSDLEEAVRIVVGELGFPVGVLNPHRRYPSKELALHASFVRQIKEKALRGCQFPTELTDVRGKFHKPPEWA